MVVDTLVGGHSWDTRDEVVVVDIRDEGVDILVVEGMDILKTTNMVKLEQ